MELVIRLSDEEYSALRSASYYSFDKYTAYLAMKDGIPLPKGHGDLIDSTKLRYKVDEDGKILITSETIIEADKGSDSE